MDDHLEQRQSGTERVGAQCKRGGRGKEAVHDIVRIRCKTDEEEQFWPLLDRMDDTFNGVSRSEPTGDGVAKEGTREDEDGECA